MDLYSREFERLVADALSNLWKIARLGMHPLSQLRATRRFLPTDKAPLTYLDRGQAVHQLIRSTLELMHQVGDNPNSSEARYHSVLTKEYVERLKVPQAAKSLGISESTFYRIRRQAVQCVAHLLAEIETATDDE